MAIRLPIAPRASPASGGTTGSRRARTDRALSSRCNDTDRDLFGGGQNSRKVVLQTEGGSSNMRPTSDIVRRSLPSIAEWDLSGCRSVFIKNNERARRKHIGPQLAFAAFSGNPVGTKGNDNSGARGTYGQKQKDYFADSGPELLYRKTSHAVSGVRHSLLGYEVFLSAISVAIAGLLTIGGAGWGATGLWEISINRRRIWTGSALAGLGFLIMLGWAAWLLLY